MQFHLSTIFLAAVVLAMSLAMGNLWYVLVAVAVVACLGIPESFLRGVAILGLLTLLVNCLLPASGGAREVVGRSRCTNNLKHLALGLHNYRDTYGAFPPACVLDEKGVPMHSWRTLILPYVEQGPLYRRYRFDEPWNGPNNSTLSQQRPLVFSCPSDPNAGKEMTSYVAVVGLNSSWDKSQPMSSQDFGTAIMLCEWPGFGIPWMEPRDLRREDIGHWLRAISSQNQGHCTAVCVATADGAVHALAWREIGDMLRTTYGYELTDEERGMLDEYTAEGERQVRRAMLIQDATLIAWLASIVVMVIHLRAIRRKPAAPAESPSEPSRPDNQ